MAVEAIEREQTPEEIVVARLDAFLEEGKHLVLGAHVIEIPRMPLRLNMSGDRSVVHLGLNKIRLRAKRQELTVRTDVGFAPDKEAPGFRVLKIYINVLRK